MKKQGLLFILIFLIGAFSAFSQSLGDYIYGEDTGQEGPENLIQDETYGDYSLFSSQKNVSLDLEEVRLIDVLKMFSQQTGLNFISTEAVRDRKLTAYLTEVPLKKAMDILFNANNLTYEFYPEANMFVVKETGKPTLELKTKVYNLKYARLSSTMMSKEVEDKLSADSEDSSSSEDSKYGIKAAVKKVLSEVGRVSEDPLTNSLIVVDVPSQFPLIDRMVQRLDTAAEQVIIEVEMLDVSKQLADKMGFNWSNGISGSFKPFAGGPISMYDPFGLVSGGSVFSGGTLDFSGSSGTQAVIEFFKQDVSTKFLARPKIVTLSGQTAIMNLTTDEAIGVITTETETGVTEEIERAETGTKLRVTPHVVRGTDEITLFVEVYNKLAKDSGFDLSGESSGTVQNVEERGTKQVVRLNEGETLYIGGLIEREDKKTVTKIPFLGDIPLIGAFFRHKSKPAANNTDRELMVFLTPRIIGRKNFFAGQGKSRRFSRRNKSYLSRQESIEVVLDKFSIR